MFFVIQQRVNDALVPIRSTSKMNAILKNIAEVANLLIYCFWTTFAEILHFGDLDFQGPTTIHLCHLLNNIKK